VTEQRPVGISLTRVFEAPRERIWREWTEPEAFADWFGGPTCEIPLDTVTMDVRPGGSWKLTMYAPPNRRQIDWWGEYVDVDPPQRLSFTIADEPAVDSPDLIVVLLTDLGDGRTEMHFEQRGFMGPQQYEAAKRGWGGFFDRMDERLA
jgi:uncharacterized protein YndB with AHSA1/START domain